MISGLFRSQSAHKCFPVRQCDLPGGLSRRFVVEIGLRAVQRARKVSGNRFTEKTRNIIGHTLISAIQANVLINSNNWTVAESHVKDLTSQPHPKVRANLAILPYYNSRPSGLKNLSLHLSPRLFSLPNRKHFSKEHKHKARQVSTLEKGRPLTF